MSARITSATGVRVLTQLRRDSRTIALLLAVPPLLLTLLKYTFDNEPRAFEKIGGPLVGLFPFMTMFLVTSSSACSPAPLPGRSSKPSNSCPRSSFHS